MVTTISVREDVKKLLEEIKGNKDWNTFLKELAEEYIAIKREKVRRKLRELLVIDDFEELRVKGWSREY
ncbi:hypothetical protein [Archaeoglobus sp.]